MLDAEGRVTTWNAGSPHFEDYLPLEVTGRHVSVFYPAEDVSAGKPGRDLLIARQSGRFEEEAIRVRKDGSRFLAHVVLTALYDAEGGVRGFAQLTRDLTERTGDRSPAELPSARARAEAAARLRGEEQLNLAQAGGHMFAWEWDPVSHEILATENAANVCGLPRNAPGSLLCVRAAKLIHPKNFEQNKATFLAKVNQALKPRINGNFPQDPRPPLRYR